MRGVGGPLGKGDKPATRNGGGICCGASGVSFGHAVIVETLAGAAGVVGMLVAAQGVVTDAVVASGDEEAQGQWLGPLAMG